MLEQHDSLPPEPQLFVSPVQLGNALQVRSVVAVPAASCSKPTPASHTVCGVQLVAFAAELKVLAGHGEQVLSFVGPPAVETYCPAGQVRHGAQVPPEA
jgi:hypothetical protein